MYMHPTLVAQLAAVHVNDMRQLATRARRAREARRARRGPLVASDAIISMIGAGQHQAQPCVAC
jgi:hypothetical protein